MHTVYVVRRRPFILVIALAALLALTLAACGTNSGTSTGAGSNPTSPVTTVKGYGTAHGCPSDAVVSNPATANVVVVLSNQNSMVMVHQGNVVEIDLPFGQDWRGPTISQGTLALQNPYGYALKDKSMCAWQFIAQGTGTTQLVYSGRAICNPTEHCPQYITEVQFTINVK